jgi:hypothetical protein
MSDLEKAENQVVIWKDVLETHENHTPRLAPVVRQHLERAERKLDALLEESRIRRVD